MANCANATNLDKTVVTGRYYAAQPERGESQKVMQLGQYQGKTVMAVAACESGCPPSIFAYLADESAQVGTDVFRNGFGQYLMHHSGTTFVTVLPDQQLGERPWTAFKFINVYSQNKAIAERASTELPTYQQFALDLSEKIMNQASAPMAHGDGEYHFAVPRTHAGKQYKSRPVTFQAAPDKRIEVAQCPKCGLDVYQYLEDESAILGIPVYRQDIANSQKYLFDLEDGVLLWAKYSQAGSGLGGSLWGENDHYNLFAKDKNYIRQLITDKSQQETLDSLLAKYSRQVKTVFDERRQQAQQEKVANQKLPEQGLSDSALTRKAGEAAQRWANAYGWKERIEYAYFTSKDWRIVRHSISGVITGRTINGVVVMRRDDGMCSFHNVSYAQDYDGTDFINLNMTGLVPGQIKLSCSKI